MTKLIIVESPTKARTIQRFLPSGYTVLDSRGHIRGMPRSASEIPAKYKQEPWSNLGINVDRDFEPIYIVFPESREMTGADLKLILEDVADNLFNPDPYYQQGGDMVRVGGLDYVCDPTQSIGDRISDMTLDDGEKVESGKTYKVAGWATVNAQSPGAPIWEVVAEYLPDRRSARIAKLNTPKLVNVDWNPGTADAGL